MSQVLAKSPAFCDNLRDRPPKEAPRQCSLQDDMRMDSCHIEDDTVRLLAHRSTMSNNHVRASPHFTVSSSAALSGLNGFARYLHSQVNPLPSLHRGVLPFARAHYRLHSHKPLAMQTQYDPEHNTVYEPRLRSEQWSNNLREPRSMMMPMQNYLMSYPPENFTSCSNSSVPTIMPPYNYDAHDPTVEPSNGLPASYSTYTAAESLPYAPVMTAFPVHTWSASPIQQCDASATLLRAVHCATPASNILDGRTITQQNVWRYDPVLESAWTTANLSYEDLAASSPESNDTNCSETITPTSSSFSSFEQQCFSPEWACHAMLNTHQKTAAPVQVVQDADILRWRTLVGERAESPMFSMTVADIDGRIRTASPEQQFALPSRPLHVLQVHPSASKTAVEERRKKDEELVAWRDQGMSYKEIKQRGNYTEVESTLRGRFRSLTKARKDRVRKPVWQEHDCQLLEIAVQRHFEDGAYGKPKDCQKIPWKRIAAWVQHTGASYAFAPATCAKKWEEISSAT